MQHKEIEAVFELEAQIPPEFELFEMVENAVRSVQNQDLAQFLLVLATVAEVVFHFLFDGQNSDISHDRLDSANLLDSVYLPKVREQVLLLVEAVEAVLHFTRVKGANSENYRMPVRPTEATGTKANSK